MATRELVQIQRLSNKKGNHHNVMLGEGKKIEVAMNISIFVKTKKRKKEFCKIHSYIL